MRSPKEDLAGRVIAGKFAIDSYVGGGAMGAVYRARQLALDKVVAIKVLHRELAAANELSAARFRREAQAASRLDHPSSIRVIDYGEEPDGLLYLAMDYVDGKDLQEVASREILSNERIVQILSQVLSALSVAHDMGVIHRDLKPENIMVVNGTDDEGRPTDVVKVCDFGLATIIDPRSDATSGGRNGVTTAGVIIGTPEYMSPEQARGQRLDARSDLYSVGVILFRLLTGALPFVAESALGVALKQISEQPARPSELRADAHPALEAICIKALRKDPKDRYQSAREMRAELRAALDPERAGVADSVRAPPAVTISYSPMVGAAAETQVLPRHAAPLSGKTGAAAKSPGAPVSGQAHAPRAVAMRRAPLAVLAVALALVVALLVHARPDHDADVSAVPTSTEVASPSSAAPSPPPSVSARPAAEVRPVVPVASTAPAARDPADVPVLPASASVAGSPSVRAALTAPKDASSQTAEPASAPPSAAADPAPVPSASSPAPQPVSSSAAPAASSAPASAPAAAPFDPNEARVVVGAVSVSGGILTSAVRSALARAPFTACYRAALRSLGSAAAGSAAVHLSIDETGSVSSATASGMGFLPGAKACVESAARGVRISGVDTGDAAADVTLTFVPR